MDNANKTMPEMTVGQLIKALKKLDSNCVVVIDIKQSNKVYGEQVGKQVTIESTLERFKYEAWVNNDYSGACITVHLPGDASIIKWPKE